MYIDYKEYLKFGGVHNETAFNKYSYEAKAKINAETHGRIKEPSEAVKRCMVRLIDICAKSDIVNDNVSSWSNDGVSKSYKDVAPEQYETKIKGIIKDYLANETDDEGIPLLYLGVC